MKPRRIPTRAPLPDPVQMICPCGWVGSAISAESLQDAVKDHMRYALDRDADAEHERAGHGY